MKFPKSLLNALKKQSIVKPSPIQIQGIPAVLTGKWSLQHMKFNPLKCNKCVSIGLLTLYVRTKFDFESS